MPNIEDQPYSPQVSAGGTSNASFSWGLIGTLIVFLLILFAALWVIRRLNRSALRGMNAPWARVLDRQVLGGQQNLYLVEIAGKLQVLGGTDHHLIKISEIEDPEVAAEILDEIANKPPERVEGILAKLMQRWFTKKRRPQAFSSELERLLEEVEK